MNQSLTFSRAKQLTEKQKQEVVELWNAEYPARINYASLEEFDQYLNELGDLHHIILADEHNTIRGWLAYFMRDDERWFAILLDSSIQGKGWGSKFLQLTKDQNRELNGWVIDHNREPKKDGSFYQSPIEFYRKIGFEIRADIPLEKKGITGIKIVWKSGASRDRLG
jgi:GNAT superfamily N-acetyltransferase